MIITKIQSDPIFSTCFDDTVSRNGRWNMIVILEDVIFSALTDGNRDGAVITGITFSAGTTIYGAFSTIELASGSCMAYKE